jgi:hypothetical protein
MKIDPNEISNYKPSYDEEDPDTEIVCVYLKNGDKFLVYLSPQEFEDKLNHVV